MTVKFHVKTITRSKVMKVLAKSLKNATNNIINYFKPVEILAFNLKKHLISLMSINPLISAHFLMKTSTHASCAKNDYLLGNSCFQCRKTDGKSNRAAQDMLHRKINHEQIRTSRLPKT